ncbi:hypothetical protein [Paenibacillus alkalitolerans]|uniref:hypothetical protein n=1 Tax=Paenibacillus alkalitolerans TaxID=2799335 RepID=UPI0018F6F69D|nr:hypothetical protein [Paenibacillus alkalitolerans]
MHVFATFEQSIFIELAISALEQKGVPKSDILAVPMDKRTEPRKLFDTIHRADGFSMFDASAILGTVFMILGAIYGFELEWGPIIWGIIGIVFGMLIGLLLKLWIIKKKDKGTKHITSEVVLIIRCEDHQWETIEKILWENTALGISRVFRRV